MGSRCLSEEPSFARSFHALTAAPPGSTVSRKGEPPITASLRERMACWTEMGPGRPCFCHEPRRGPIPLNPQRIDPTWYYSVHRGSSPSPPVSILAALPALPLALREAVCRAAGLRPGLIALDLPEPIVQAAARQQWAHLTDMPGERLPRAAELTIATPAPRIAAAFASLPAHVLQSALLWAGAPAMGILLRHLSDRAAAGICGRLPTALRQEAWRWRRCDLAGGELAPPSRQDLLGLHAERGTLDASRLVFTLGARQVAAFLGSHLPPTTRQAAQLLPLPAGRTILEKNAATPPQTSFVLECLLKALEPTWSVTPPLPSS
jgi:hypothetical protein